MCEMTLPGTRPSALGTQITLEGGSGVGLAQPQMVPALPVLGCDSRLGGAGGSVLQWLGTALRGAVGPRGLPLRLILGVAHILALLLLLALWLPFLP